MPQSAEPGWAYELLGVNRLTLGRKTFAPERKTAALLCYLALEGSASRSKLAGLLWPGSEEATARNNLSQALRRLRHLTGEPLVLTGDTLQLQDGLRVDAVNLKKAALSGDAQAVAAYQGELLSTFDYDDLPEFHDWLWSTRETLRALYREALDTLVTTFEAQGELATALKYAERSVETEPVSEIAHRHVMRLYYLRGDRAAALKAYRRCQEALARELGVTPLPETVHLARMIERGEVRRAAGVKQTRSLPLEMLRPPVLVGREAAWAALETA